MKLAVSRGSIAWRENGDRRRFSVSSCETLMKNNELLSRIDACHMTRIARCKVLESSHPLRQQHRRTCLPTLNSSPSIVVVISAHLPSSQSLSLPTEHSLFHAHVPLSATEVLLSQDCVCGTVCRLRYKTDHQLRTFQATSEITFIQGLEIAAHCDS